MKRKSYMKVLYLLLVMFLFVGHGFAQNEETNVVYLPTLFNSSGGMPLPEPPPMEEEWATVAANPYRTSWTPTEVTGNMNLQWYRPIEAYIPQNVQLIAANGLIYVSTSKGLYALGATDGSEVWRYETEMPLGNSPTVVGSVLYVGGYDRKLHAINALTGQHLWSFDGADSGYDTNPLVVGDVVYMGNRDGAMYAVGAHGTENQGQLIWKYQTSGAIHLSAAYQDGKIYFASNDMHAYALNADTGSLVWKSEKLPGMQYQSFWPVIYGDKVIFSVAHGYRDDREPGLRNVEKLSGDGYYGHVREMQLDNIFPGAVSSTGSDIFDDPAPSQDWAHGYPAVDANRITQYLEDDPQPDAPHLAKPWRRIYVVLDISNGHEFTFDSDNDGYAEYIPIAYWGTGSGNSYPPIVGEDGILYFGNIYECCSDSKGRVMGWNINTPQYLSFLGPIQVPVGGYGALAEPQALSAGGDVVYRNLCCDRVGDWVNYLIPAERDGTAWSYDLDEQAPGYDPMWFIDPGSISRHRGWYVGNSNSVNGAYHNHGVQNPIIPYFDRLFVHRSNTIFAFGTDAGGPGQLPVLMAGQGQITTQPIPESEIQNRLEVEIQKMVDAGHLRPGYYGMAQFLYPGLVNYFENPGETLYTLSLAYPYLSNDLQSQVRTYLREEFQTYFDDEMYSRSGWNPSYTPREDMILPKEVSDAIGNNQYPPSIGAGGGWSWGYPQYNFYGMWKYAQNVPGVDALVVYNLAKRTLMVPIPDLPGGQTDYFRKQPFELNGWIAGYIGFLELQSLAGMSGTDSSLRNQVSNELDNMIQLRKNIFSKDSYWSDPYSPDYNYYKKKLDIARNFMYLVPELAQELSVNQVQEAVDEYEYVAPYWFVSRYEATMGEGVMADLYTYNAILQAKGQILGESQAALSKYLDVPAFARGDLYYIQQLITLLNAQ